MSPHLRRTHTPQLSSPGLRLSYKQLCTLCHCHACLTPAHSRQPGRFGLPGLSAWCRISTYDVLSSEQVAHLWEAELWVNQLVAATSVMPSSVGTTLRPAWMLT